MRELALRISHGLTSDNEQLRLDVEVLLVAMRAYHSALGRVTSQCLQRLIDDPSQTLPRRHAHARTNLAFPGCEFFDMKLVTHCLTDSPASTSSAAVPTPSPPLVGPTTATAAVERTTTTTTETEGKTATAFGGEYDALLYSLHVDEVGAGLQGQDRIREVGDEVFVRLGAGEGWMKAP